MTEEVIDLYADLGVARDATPEEIKAAYRRLAMQHHPDRGGDDEEFKKVQNAYDVLSDLGKRAEYDATGKIPGRKIDEEEMLRREAIKIFSEAINSVGDKPYRVDIVEVMVMVVNDKQNEFTRVIVKTKKQIETLEKCRPRMKRKDGAAGPNALGEFIDANLLAARDELRRLEEMLTFGERLLEYIKTYTFEAEPTPVSTAPTFTFRPSGWPPSGAIG